MNYTLNVTENKAGEVFCNETDLSYEDLLKAIKIHLGYGRDEAQAMVADAHIHMALSSRPAKFYGRYSPKGVFVTATLGTTGEPE